MTALVMILWGAALLGLLHLAVPSHYMRCGEAGNGAYYLYWGGTVAGTMIVMYQLMQRFGLVRPYIVTSTILICLFLAWRGLLWFLHARWCENGDEYRYEADDSSPSACDSPSKCH